MLSTFLVLWLMSKVHDIEAPLRTLVFKAEDSELTSLTSGLHKKVQCEVTDSGVASQNIEPDQMQFCWERNNDWNRCHLKMTVCTILSPIPERERGYTFSLWMIILPFFFSNQVLVCIWREEDDIVELELGGF